MKKETAGLLAEEMTEALAHEPEELLAFLVDVFELLTKHQKDVLVEKLWLRD